MQFFFNASSAALPYRYPGVSVKGFFFLFILFFLIFLKLSFGLGAARGTAFVAFV